MNSTLTRTWTAVLFDLDGTIIDSAPGIIQSLTDTFNHLNLPVPSHDELMAYIGPPLIHSLQERAGLSEEAAREALQVYRSDYRKDGIFDAAIFPGIEGLFEALTERGIPIAIATSKPEEQAARVLEHFGLSEYTTVIAGAVESQSRIEKADIIKHALEELSARGVDTSNSVLVGDRIYDVAGGAANGIPAIIVEWGYGSPAEAEGALATVYSADKLRELLIG